MAALLTHVNNTLALIGEQPLINTTGNLGELAKRSLQSALYKLVAETKHSGFLTQTTTVVSTTDYLVPALALPARCIQLKNIYWRSTNSTNTPPLEVVKLLPSTFDKLDRNWAYCIVGNNVYIGHRMPRPFTAIVEAYIAPTLSGLTDAGVVVVPEETEIALEAVAAALLSSSYLDDLAAQSSLQKRAENELLQLRMRAGSLRAPISWRN